MKKATSLAEVERHITDHDLSLVYITAPKCGVCSVLHHKLKSFAEREQLAVIEADIAQLPSLAGRFLVFTAPTLLLFWRQQEILRQAHFIRLNDFGTKLSSYQDLSH